MRRAEQLDPVSPAISTELGMTYNFARQPDRAIAQLQKALEIDPTFARARYNMAEAYEQKGLLAQAAAILDEDAPEVVHSYVGRIVINRFRILTGAPSETREILNELLTQQVYVPRTFVAELYAMIGQHDEAFRWLERAYEDGGLYVPRLYVDPRWERYPIYSDPRFSALLRRAGLPPTP